MQGEKIIAVIPREEWVGIGSSRWPKSKECLASPASRIGCKI
jgi:hypothetical protein